MDMTGIAGASTAMSGSRFFAEVTMAVLKKGLDVAEVQGEAIQEMLDTAVTDMAAASGHILDTYA
ncbi:MAG: putative motility protein [Lachnospiraceae bacterium]|jgi:hypothetical protein|nr:putative motility protein [Lachnospiraceae bacterium]